jgi:hypothetical protein
MPIQDDDTPVDGFDWRVGTVHDPPTAVYVVPTCASPDQFPEETLAACLPERWGLWACPGGGRFQSGRTPSVGV